MLDGVGDVCILLGVVRQFSLKSLLLIMNNSIQSLGNNLHSQFMTTYTRPSGFWALVATSSGTVQHTFNSEADLLAYHAKFK